VRHRPRPLFAQRRRRVLDSTTADALPGRHIFIGLLLAALLLLRPAPAAAALPDLGLVLAVTEPTEHPPGTTLFVYHIKRAMRQDIYRDDGDERRVLVKIASSDVTGAARVVGGSAIYAMRGPAQVESPAACSDTLSRLELRPGDDAAEWQPLLPIPLCFSNASPYGLWNRAPIFSVSADGSRIAMPVVRIGEAQLDQPAIRVLSAEGTEEWRVPLPGEWMEVADLAWSRDAKRLAYLVRPQADEHTIDEAQLSIAGLYLADIGSREVRRVSDCAGSAVAWGPGPNQITIAGGAFPGTRAGGVVSILELPGGVRVEEFSARGIATALSYSPDQQWLAVQTISGTKQAIWLHPVSGGWGSPVYELPTGTGRLSLVGWATALASSTDM
jgi:hypothetical protein